MKKISVMIMMFLAAVSFLNFSVYQVDARDYTREREEFKTVRENNCYKLLAYMYAKNNLIEEPDLGIYVFYKHSKKTNGDHGIHDANDVYGVIIYYSNGPVWGTNLRIVIKGQDSNTGRYIFDDFLNKVPRIGSRGEIQEYEKKIISIISDLFNGKIDDNTAADLLKIAVEKRKEGD